MSKVAVPRLHRSSEAECTVVGAAHRFRTKPAPVGRGLVESAKVRLALLVTQNLERFEPRDVAAWTAYLRGHQ